MKLTEDQVFNLARYMSLDLYNEAQAFDTNLGHIEPELLQFIDNANAMTRMIEDLKPLVEEANRILKEKRRGK